MYGTSNGTVYGSCTLTVSRDQAEAELERRMARVASVQAVLDAYAAQRLAYPSDILADMQRAVRRAQAYAARHDLSCELETEADA